LLLLLLLNELDAKSENYESLQQALSRELTNGGAVSPSLLNPSAFEEYKGAVYKSIV
jgi:hypothetical protein